MNNELFGVFGDGETFDRFRDRVEFDRVVEGSSVTVGIRDVSLGIPGRTQTATDGDDVVVLSGEIYHDSSTSPAEWLLEAVPQQGTDALSALNGSYVAVVDVDSETFVATDRVRSRECFHTADPGVRLFGTDPTPLARAIDAPTIDRGALQEFVLLGVVLGDRTVYEQLERVPFDGLLREGSTAHLSRFVYEPQEFDYATELARRLERAIKRRTNLPGRSGVMLSAGYDSRTILSCAPDVEVAYTIGEPDSQEAQVAATLAAQYDTDHEMLAVDDRYLNTTPKSIQYGQGIKESLQVHQAGYEPQMEVDTIYHGLLFDTFLRGHFQPLDGVELFGKKIPRERPKPDPDPVGALLSKFGYMEQAEPVFEEIDVYGDSCRRVARDAVAAQFETAADRYESVHNGIACVGIQNQPTIPFRAHLADQYLESFIAIDTELIDWHLTTPPEHRTTRTFLKALRKIDPDLLRNRPPDRPHDSRRLNQMERFVRRKVPGVTPFESAWPDRRTLYDRNDLDRELFGSYPRVQRFPPRIKLRVNDISSWVNATRSDGRLTPAEVVDPRV